MVFFSSCNSVKFHSELLNFIDIKVMDIHGKQKQQKRSSTFFEFSKAESGTLLCTDVAARGLDIPAVDWIVQFDPPDEPREYIHRVGRTARGTDGKGKALLFLMPEELGFLSYLKSSKVLFVRSLRYCTIAYLVNILTLIGVVSCCPCPCLHCCLHTILAAVSIPSMPVQGPLGSVQVPLNEYEFPTSKVANVQSELERLIEKNYYLNQGAKDAFRAYVLAYHSHSLKDIFNVHNLDLAAMARSFGFVKPPRVCFCTASKRKGSPLPVQQICECNPCGPLCSMHDLPTIFTPAWMVLHVVQEMEHCSMNIFISRLPKLPQLTSLSYSCLHSEVSAM
jgi:ATP-dependent RNA helicase DDX18/HAS1